MRVWFISHVLKQELSIDEFQYNPAGACQISAAARRKYLAALLNQWQQSVKARGAMESQSYLTHFYQQALSFKAFVRDGVPFTAWRQR